MATLYRVSGGTGWSASSGGTGDQTRTDTDALVYDANSPAETLTAALTCAGLQILGTYAAAFSDGGYAVAVSGSYCWLIADAGTITLSGDWTISSADIREYEVAYAGCDLVYAGISDFRKLGNTVSGSPTLLVDTGAVLTARSTSADGYSYSAVFGLQTFASMTIRGTLANVTNHYVLLAAVTTLDGGDLVAAPLTYWQIYNAGTARPLVNNGLACSGSGDVKIAARFSASNAITLGPGDYTALTEVRAGNGTGSGSEGKIVFAAGTFHMPAMAASPESGYTSTIDAATNSPTVYVHGDVENQGDGTQNWSGLLILAGTADQTVDLSGADTLPTFAVEKSAGVVTLTGSGNVTAGGDWDAFDVTMDASMSGTIDLDAYDLTGADGGSVILDGSGEFDCGSGTISITNGTFDNKDVGTFTQGTSTVVLAGASSILTASNNELYDLEFAASSTISIPSGTQLRVAASHSLMIGADAAITIAADKQLGVSGDCDCTIGAGATIGGFGQFTLYNSTSTHGLTSMDTTAEITCETWVYQPASGARLDAGTYTGFVRASAVGLNQELKLDAGTYDFDGGLELESTGAGDVTLDAATNEPVVNVTSITFDLDSTGNVVVSQGGAQFALTGNAVNEITGGGSPNWTATTGLTELDGSGNHDIGLAVPNLYSQKSAGNITHSGGASEYAADSVAPASLIVSAGASLSVASGKTLTHDGTILTVGSGASITGAGTLNLAEPHNATYSIDAAATIDIATVRYVHDPGETSLYWDLSDQTGTLILANDSVTEALIEMAAGTIACGGSLVYAATVGDLVIDYVTNAGILDAAGTVSLDETGGRVAVLVPGVTLPDSLGSVDTIAAAVVAAMDASSTQLAAIVAAIAGLNDLSASEVNAEVGTALAEYDGPTAEEMDAAIAALQSHGDDVWKTLVVLPMRSTVSAGEVTRGNVTLYQHMSINLSFTVTDDAGAAVDVSGKQIAMIVYSRDTIEEQWRLTSEDGEIMVGGDDSNVVYVEGDESYTETAGTYDYIVVNDTDKKPLAMGSVTIKASPEP